MQGPERAPHLLQSRANTQTRIQEMARTQNAQAELPAFVSIGRVEERLFSLTQLLRPRIGRHLDLTHPSAPLPLQLPLLVFSPLFL